MSRNGFSKERKGEGGSKCCRTTEDDCTLLDLHESGVWCEYKEWISSLLTRQIPLLKRNDAELQAVYSIYKLTFALKTPSCYTIFNCGCSCPQSLVVTVANTQHDKHIKRFYFAFRLPYKRRLRWHIQIDLAVTWETFFFWFGVVGVVVIVVAIRCNWLYCCCYPLILHRIPSHFVCILCRFAEKRFAFLMMLLMLRCC